MTNPFDTGDQRFAWPTSTEQAAPNAPGPGGAPSPPPAPGAGGGGFATALNGTPPAPAPGMSPPAPAPAPQGLPPVPQGLPPVPTPGTGTGMGLGTPGTPPPPDQGQPQRSEEPTWRLGDPVTPREGLSSKTSTWVAGRAPAVGANGKQIEGVPGMPVYPMPVIDKFEPDNSGGRYRVPDPVTGAMSSFPRATTISKAVKNQDNGSLSDWKDQMLIYGLATNPQLMDGFESDLIGTENEWRLKRVTRQVSENARIAAGSADGREFGTAFHAWTEAIDRGDATFEDVPAPMHKHMASYLVQMQAAQIEVLPEYVERVVCFQIERPDPDTGEMRVVDTVVGTVDRIYRLADGRLVIGDVKTSANISYAWTEISAQLSLYANAKFMLAADGSGWEPMPDVDKHLAVVVSAPHTPKDRGIHCDLFPISLTPGKQLIDLALAVREVNSAEVRNSIAQSPITQTFTADDAIAMVRSGQVSATSDGPDLSTQADRAADSSVDMDITTEYGPDKSDPLTAQAVSAINDATDPETIIPMWEPWWSDELVAHAQRRIAVLERKAAANAKRAATNAAKKKAKAEAEAEGQAG